jgi:hypothetical protein
LGYETMQNYIGYIGGLCCFVLACGSEPISDLEIGTLEQPWWVIYNGSEVHIPAGYGTYRYASSRCNADQSTWIEDCKVETNRKETLCFDLSVCEQVSQNLTDAVFDAVWNFDDVLRNHVGWGYENDCSIMVRCSTATAQSDWGYTAADVDGSCWNVPGKNVCWTQNSQNVWIYTQKIENHYGNGVEGQNLTYNITLHELLHGVSIGHDSTDHSVMSNSEVFSEGLDYRMNLTSTQYSALRNFGRHVEACNWQPGDVLGDSCPSR